MFEKVDSENEQLLLSASFTAKFQLVFALTLENDFSQRFHFKANKNSVGSSKNGTWDFQNSSLFERSTCFYVTISGNFERFQYFNFETLTFWKTNIFFKKLEYRFLVESTKIENASFPYKTAISEANVMTNRMVSPKWTYHKENDFIFLIFFFFLFKNLL